MKSLVAIILLSGVLAMNMGMFCQSLCLTDHHKGMSSQDHIAHQHHKMSEQKMPNGEMCPVTHAGHGAHHTMPQTVIKCGCSSDEGTSSVSETALIKSSGDLVPYFQVISKVILFNPVFSSREPIPLESPPNLLS